jgi:uncharacterized repeat protein (TIGR01451 family)
MLLAALPAVAAPVVTDEVSGGSAAARTAAQALRGSWETAVLAGTGSAAPAPMVLGAAAGTDITGVIGTTAAGTTVSVQRTRYTADPLNPQYAEPSTNPGTATCGTGLAMQDNSPRPSSLAGAGCGPTIGTAYSESGGAGESTTRDAVEFTFSRPVWAFGAWFGDLETRTDGLGVPAIVRLLDDNNVLLDEFVVTPIGDQSLCGGTAPLCGNRTTRFIGFTDELVSRMVVIVGDNDAGGDALSDGLGFIGPTAVDAVPAITAAIDSSAIGPVTAGTTVQVPVTLSNPGDVEVSTLTGATCAATAVAAGGTLACTTPHVVSQPELDAGSFSASVTAGGSWWGLSAGATDSATIPLVQSTVFAASIGADRSSFSAVGETIGYTVTVANNGNITAAPDSVQVPGVVLGCLPAGTVAPGGTIICTGSLTTTTGADVARTATVLWPGGSQVSGPVNVAWNSPPPPSYPASLSRTGSTMPTLLIIGTAVSMIVGAGMVVRSRTARSRKLS